MGAKVIVKSVLRIRDYEIDNVPRDFDLAKAADYTYELADAYTVALEFFDGPSRTGDYMLFPNSLDVRQKLGLNAKNNYKGVAASVSCQSNAMGQATGGTLFSNFKAIPL